tara:strand:- start:1157 stop:2551 length:1395 start_codon:yes stop_codon:yes gene_type:complete
MKYLNIFIVAFLFSLSLNAQYKGSVNKARSLLDKAALSTYMSEIKPLLVEAKGEVDQAIKIEKNRSKVNTWIIRGDVYAAIAKGLPELDSMAIEKSLEAYNKVGTEIKTKDINAIQNANAGRQNLSTFFINDAITALQGTNDPNYERAYNSFMLSLRVNPSDTLGLLYGGFVAEQLKKYEEALSYYSKLIDMNTLNSKNSNTIFQNSINIYYQNCELFSECEDFNKSLSLIMKAKDLFPDNNYYPSVEINIAMRLNKVDEARTKIDQQLQSDPDNANLHFNRAVLYYNLGLALTDRNDFSEAEKLDTLDNVFGTAIESYKESLQLDPSNERALLYMLDAFKAHAKPYFDAERNLDFLALKGKYESESNRLKNEGNSRISEGSAYAISYMEMKGDEITNDDIATIYPIFSITEDHQNLINLLSISILRDNTNIEYLEVLRRSYIQLKDYENAENIYQMILELENN